MVIALVTYVAFYVVRMERPAETSTCSKLMYNTQNNPDVTATSSWYYSSSLRNVLFFGVIRVVLAILGCSIFYHSYDKVATGLFLTVLFGGYFLGLYACEQFKHASADYECSTKPNGFSGHSFYGTWAIITTWYLCEVLFEECDDSAEIAHRLNMETWKSGTRVTRRGSSKRSAPASSVPPERAGAHDSPSDDLGSGDDRFSRSLDHSMMEWRHTSPSRHHATARVYAKIATLLTVFYCVAVQLFYTHYYGYHSIQQMVLGSCWAMLWTGLSIAACDWVQRLKRESTILYTAHSAKGE